METSNVLGFAIAAVLAGIAILGLVYLGARLSNRGQAPLSDTPPVISSELNQLNTAVVVARRGGSVVFTNERARQLFGLNGGLPNLNQMARLAQPQESFLALFADQGQATLTVANRPIEATSVRIPGDTPQFVIMLRESAQLSALRATDRTGQAFAALGEINKQLSASLELKTTVDNILDALGRIIQFDLAELNLYDSDVQLLRPQGRTGERTYVLALEQRVPLYRLDDGYTGWIARNKKSLIVPDIRRRVDTQPKFNLDDFPFQSALGVPLLHGADRQLIGTLEVASFELGAYSQQDAVLLETLAEQAAVAIRNAQHYSRLESRVAELTGLAQVARTASALADPRELYSSLNDKIAKLLNVHICGFLLYDDTARMLMGQSPFQGIPDAVLSLYQIAVQPNTAADKLWRETEHWFTNDANADDEWKSLGLSEVSRMIGLRTTLLMPLVAGGNKLGLVQVGNKLNNAHFNDDDVRLLKLFAGQAAVLLDNARLVREAEKRAARADGLRIISEITGSELPLEEIYKQVMAHLAALLDADKGVVVLLDEAKGELAPQRGSEFGGDYSEAEFARRSTDSADYRLSVTATRRPFFSRRVSRDRRVTGTYRSAIERYQVETVIIVPLIVQNICLGELWIGTVRANTFVRADVDLVATAASQLAAAIERNRLASATDNTLRRRVEQLTALTRVGRELNQTIELRHILNTVYDEAVTATRADCGSIVLLESDPETPVGRMRLGAHSGDLALDALQRDVALSGVSHIIPDITAPNAYHMIVTAGMAALPNADEHGIRSLLIVPITYQGVSVGILELHSARANAFDKSMLDFSQALAAQAAIAVGNARRYEEQLQRGELLRRRAEQLSQLLQISRSVRSDRSLVENLDAIAYGVQEAVGFNVVLISVLDPNTGLLHRTASAGVPLGTFEQLRQNPASWNSIELALRAEFRISQSYFIPRDKSPGEFTKLEAITLRRDHPSHHPDTWQQDDVLFVPLIGSGGQPLGMMSVDDPRDGKTPDRLVVETLEIFANQAALAIENARLFQAAETRAAELSSSLAELQKSYADLDAVSRALTRKEQEHSHLIEQADLRAKRLLALHRIASATAEIRDELTFMQRTAEATIERMNLDLCLIAFKLDAALRVVAQAGSFDVQNIDIEALLTTHNPLAQIDEMRSPILIRELGAHGWGESKLVQTLELRSFVGVPIFIANKFEGAILVGSKQERSPFGREDIDLFTLLAGQVGVSIENMRLYATAQNYAADLEQRVDERTADLAQERDRVETLLRINNELSASLDLDRVLTRALSIVHDYIGASQGGLFLVDPVNEQLIYRAAIGVTYQLNPGGQPAPFRVNEGLVGWVIRHRKAVIVPDLIKDERWIRRPLSEHHRSALCVPLVSSEDSLGAMVFFSNQPDAFNEEQLLLVSAAANQVTSAVNNAELYRLIRDQAERLGGMLRSNQVEATKSRAILESIADGVMVTDPDGKIILFNATAESILRLKRDDVVGRQVNAFMGLYGAGAKSLTEAIQKWSNETSSYFPGNYIAARIELDDKRIVSILLTPVTSRDEYLGSVSIFRDITREVEVDRLKTEFVTTVSHELRTPMTSIKGYADLLLMGAGGSVSDEQKRFLDVIKSNADRLKILVDDLLDISKIESGKVELRMEPVSIIDVIRDAVAHIKGRMSEQGKTLALAVDVSPDLPPVPGDRQRIAQIITNIADNAFIYTHDGGQVKFSANVDGDVMIVSVSDTGIGIAPDDQHRIFERFYRGEDPLVLASAGTGLGLSIVQRLVEMHSGRIWVESDGIGKGSTFHVLFNLPGSRRQPDLSGNMAN